MLINEILSNQEQTNLVRLIMNTTLNAHGQATQPTHSTNNLVVQAVNGNRKAAVKEPEIPEPPAPKKLPKTKPSVPAKTWGAGRLGAAKHISSQSLTHPSDNPVSNLMSKRSHPSQLSTLSSINKKLSPSKKELEKEYDIKRPQKFTKLNQNSEI